MSNKHLIHEERFAIQTLLRKERSLAEIAGLLERAVSTISREIQRNSNPSGTYTAAAAQKRFEKRAAEASCRQSRVEAARWDFVKKHIIEDQWSPQQIQGRMKLDGLQPLSHEAIYQYILADKRKGGTLHSHLRHKIGSYRKRGSGKERRGRIPNIRPIENRPKVVEERTRIGDYEMDSVIGTLSGETLITMVDRRSRHTLMLKSKNKSALATTGAIVKAMLPYEKRIHTLTYDNGKEFSYHQLIDKILDSTGYFANPYHSWERGLNENTNGLIRQYFPKKTDFGKITDQEIARVEKKLNNRPRKCLGWKTPHEVMFSKSAIVALPG